MEATIEGRAVNCPMDPESKLLTSPDLRIVPTLGLQYYFTCCRVSPSNVAKKV